MSPYEGLTFLTSQAIVSKRIPLIMRGCNLSYWNNCYNIRGNRTRALKHLAAEILGVNIQEKEHCPVSDF